MSANIAQIYTNNPINSLNPTDLLYIGAGGTTDGAIQYGDLANQIGAGLWAPGVGTGAVQGFNVSGATGNYCLAFGLSVSVTGDYAVAFGNSTQATGIGTFAMGNTSQAASSGNQADYSFAFGNQSTTASMGPADYSFAFGNSAAAGVFGSGNYSFAFGHNTSTGQNGGADYSFSFGNTCKTTGSYTFAFGNGAIVNNDGSVVWGDANAAPNEDSLVNQYNLTFANGYRFFGGSFNVSTVGKGLAVAEGSNAKQGIATLSGGTVSVANTSVTANSRIFLTAQDDNSVGVLRVSARTASTSFTITSSDNTDSGVVAYQIFEPAV